MRDTHTRVCDETDPIENAAPALRNIEARGVSFGEVERVRPLGGANLVERVQLPVSLRDVLFSLVPRNGDGRRWGSRNRGGLGRVGRVRTRLVGLRHAYETHGGCGTRVRDAHGRLREWSTSFGEGTRRRGRGRHVTSKSRTSQKCFSKKPKKSQLFLCRQESR